MKNEKWGLDHDIHHHFIRHMVESGHITLDYLTTDEQTANVLTKGLTREKHNRFVKDMGLCHEH